MRVLQNMTGRSNVYTWSYNWGSREFTTRRHNWAVQRNSTSTELPLGQSLTRRERKAAATRRALFHAGLEAFGRRPFALVSVIDLTETVDVAKGVFYLHFKSKDEFLIELFRDVLRHCLEGFHIALSAVPARSARSARIQIVARQYIAFATANPAATRFLVRMAGYFPDEIGPPGALVGVRTEYREQLAAALTPNASRAPGEFERRAAAVMDSCCWGLIADALHLGTALPDENTLIQVTSSVIRSASAAQRGT